MDLSKPAVTASQSTASIEKAFRREGNGCTATFEGQVRERNRFLPSGKSNLEQVAQDGGGESTVATQGQGKMLRADTGISIILSYTLEK